MTKIEFEIELDKCGYIRVVPADDYKLIEQVYNFHPNISETRGKEQVAYLYGEFGIGIFRDMLATAERAEDLEDEIQATRHKLTDLLDQYNDLKKGDL